MVLFGFILIVYFIVGYIITRQLIKRGVVDTATDFWFFLTLWLWIAICIGIVSLFKAIWFLPKKLAHNQINKHS
ncbi:Hypothetical protein KNT65_gp103 [Escherichia phage EcS1]|uniref:Uncharacterized protein n=1 Tax=Escherichia phage EcS1 TaxID=2083276 RepID=A0A2Z5ZCI5_9CAUD|nr:Hypothetical protein KNT65_gp103 [Escherichia phage EcS1]BBC78151.1 Hypothetical protein [Escherichia phage EcS1]